MGRGFEPQCGKLGDPWVVGSNLSAGQLGDPWVVGSNLSAGS